MKVKVKLFATLRKHCKIDVPEGEFEMDLPSGATAEDLVLKLGLSKETVKVVVVNNQKVSYSEKLSNGDNIRLFPLIAGG